MQAESRPAKWHVVTAADYGGLPSFLRERRGVSDVPTAGGWSLDARPDPGRGLAWSDDEFLGELRAAHQRMQAPKSSMLALGALEQGAACVICGQQPGVGGGPLYTWWKIAGAVVLARELQRRMGRRVVPVYWCGSDDSDFAEVRRAYYAIDGRAPARLELPGRLWSAGQMVGELSARAVDALEAPIRNAPSPGLSSVRDWGESFGAQMLSDFQQSGLVVVDARSPVLLQRGRDLFERGLKDREIIQGLLTDRGQRLRADGWPESLSARAMNGPVFRERDGRRERIDEANVEVITAADRLMPSVLLRPLWQDRELSPLAVVLGPGELAYHAQLEPLYEHFEIAAPRTMPRPHLTVLPPRSGAEWTAEELSALVSSRATAQNVLTERAIDPATAATLEEMETEINRKVLHSVSQASGALRSALERFHRRNERELRRLRRRVARQSRPAISDDLRWLWPAGLPQERALCTQSLRAMGWSGDDVVSAISDDYLRAVSDKRIFCAMVEIGGKVGQQS